MSIDDAMMGDVWPAVEPGRDAQDYGSVRLEPTAPCPVRSFQTFTVTYAAGKFGLDDTGAIRIAFRWVHDRGPLQTDDPAAMNYVSAVSSSGVPLSLLAEPFGYRPWGGGVRVTVEGGYLDPGDEIRVTFGDRSGGSPGFRMQTIAEQDFEFRVSADTCATGFFNLLPDRLCVPIIAGPPHIWKVIAPGLRRPGEPFRIGIVAEDLWGNPARPGPVTVRLSASHQITGLPEEITFAPDQHEAVIEGCSIEAPADITIRLSDAQGTHLATANPIEVRDGPVSGFWGDLHGQSGETVGIGTIDAYLAFARDIALLDVSGHQGNDFQISNAFWDKINRITTEMNRDGQFIVFPGYEWSGNTPVGGDHNVFFRHEGRQIRRSSHAQLTDRSDLDTDANTLDALFTALQGEDCVLWSHVGGRPADVSYGHDPALKTAVEVHSNWGTFEWILTDSLALGHRVGIVASSDGHKGRPGAGPPGATEFGAYGGLTCFLAPALTRDAVFECMRRRHHYGTSGSRILLDVRARHAAPAQLYTRDPDHFDVTPEEVYEAIMGDIVRPGAGTGTLAVQVNAPAPIERVDVMQGPDLLQTLRPYAEADLGNRVRVYWRGAEYRGRGRNTRWQGEIEATGAVIIAMDPVNCWNHERRPVLETGNRVRFDQVTSGNFAGVDLMLDSEEAVLQIRSNRVSGDVRLDALGLEDTILDAGGLERQILVRRLPDHLDHRTFAAEIALPTPSKEAAIWVRVTTSDGHQAWSSPIYMLPV
ncbi:MAG: DUF3604 domain-containing protein [Pseudomonadota bacterium]